MDFDRSFRILSIDGGGARGIIPAVILKEVERRANKPISHLFDRICGTSTGAILACALSAPKKVGERKPMFTAAEIVEIYRELGQSIFSRGSFNDRIIKPVEEIQSHEIGWYLIRPKKAEEAVDTILDIWDDLNEPLHRIHKLAFVLYRFLGDLRMRDALTELFVYAYDVGSMTPASIGSSESEIKGAGAADFSNYRMYQAATASSAAVPFFEPYTVWEHPQKPAETRSVTGAPTNHFADPGGAGDAYDFVDGGNGGLGSPALFAAIEETDASRDKKRFVLSLGTGHHETAVSDAVKEGGFVQWLLAHGDLLRNVFDGEADVTEMVLRSIPEKYIDYLRWQPDIDASLDFLDEGSESDMKKLENVARGFIAKHDEDIDALVEVLLKPRLRRAS